ncbi:MAG: elongator complex protein 4, partial [Thaumarchaeota archaeon]|nr:elongator complex protein 4 [Nitrososphaerota archaeon]
LDDLLAGHAGLPLGTSLLIEEQGTTDFAGALLRYYAAEGLVQGHQVHVLGFAEGWKTELPGLAAERSGSKAEKLPSPSEDKMKIAWRYEALGHRGAPDVPPNRPEGGDTGAVFRHSFDLTKRLAQSAMKGALHAAPSSDPFNLSFEAKDSPSPFRAFLRLLHSQLASSSPETIHRVVVPSLLSPAFYTGGACHPAEVLQFLHALRALLRRHSTRLTALITLPVSLYPRNTGLTRWMEILSDGVLELIPLHTNPIAAMPKGSSDKSSSKDAEKAQGLLKVHSMPIYHEKGGGGAEGNYFRENLSFSLSSSRGLVIKPYSLPPMEGDEHKEKSPASTAKDGIEF